MRLAKIISVASSPTFLSIPAFALFSLVISHPLVLILFLTAVLFSTFLPLLFIYILFKMGKVADMEVSDRRTRWIPFLGAIASYASGTGLLWYLGAPIPYTALMFCYFGNTLITALISLHWKISVHAIGLAGPVTFLIVVFGWVYALLLPLIIPIGWSRVKLGAHTWTQVIVGFLLAIPMTYFWLSLLFLVI